MRDESLYTPEEIAQMLKLSKYTIYEMIKRGEIPAHRIGRSLRVSDSQLDAYLIEVRQGENVVEGETVIVNGVKYGRALGITGELYFSIATDLEGSIRMSIKPEEIILAHNRIVSSARNVHEGIITAIGERDNGFKLTVNIGIPLAVLITKQSLQEMGLKIGDSVFCIFKAMAVVVV